MSVTATNQNQIEQIVSQEAHQPLGNIHIKLNDKRVHLEGEIESYFAKQKIQESIRQLDRELEINNNLKVSV